jgi:predicted exporter
VKRRRAVVLLAFAIASALLAVYVVRHFETSSGVTHFLVGTDDALVASLAQRIADSPASRTLILGVRAPTRRAPSRAARAWAGELARHPEVATVRSGPDPATIGAAHDLYFPRRFLFLAPRPSASFRSGSPTRDCAPPRSACANVSPRPRVRS